MSGHGDANGAELGRPHRRGTPSEAKRVDAGGLGSDHLSLTAPLPLLAAVNFAPDVEAFLGGIGVGLTAFFCVLVVSLGVGVIRRMLD